MVTVTHILNNQEVSVQAHGHTAGSRSTWWPPAEVGSHKVAVQQRTDCAFNTNSVHYACSPAFLALLEGFSAELPWSSLTWQSWSHSMAEEFEQRSDLSTLLLCPFLSTHSPIKSHLCTVCSSYLPGTVEPSASHDNGFPFPSN